MLSTTKIDATDHCHAYTVTVLHIARYDFKSIAFGLSM